MAVTQRIRRAPAPRALLLCALGGLFVVAWLLLTSVAAQAEEAGAGPVHAVPGAGEARTTGPQPSPARTGPDLRETTRTTLDSVDREQPRAQVRRAAQSVSETVDAVRNGAEDEVRSTTRTVRETLRASIEQPVRDTVDETAGQVQRRVAEVVDAPPMPVPDAPTHPLPVPEIDAPAPDVQDVSEQRRSASAAHGFRGVAPTSSSTDPAPDSVPAQPTLLASSDVVAPSPAATVEGGGFGLGSATAPALPASGSVDLPQRGAGAAAGADVFLTQISAAADRLAGRGVEVSWWFSQAPAFRPTVSPD